MVQVSTTVAVIEGLTILQDAGAHQLRACQDILFAGEMDDIRLTDEQKRKLESLGWFVHDEIETWAIRLR